MLGEKSRGIEIVQSNVDFGYVAEMSKVVLNHLKAGELMSNFKEIIETRYKNEIERRRIKFLASIKDSELQATLTQYFASCDVEAFAGFECLMQGNFQESKQYFSRIDEYCNGLYILGTMYAKGLEVGKDYKKASECYNEAAMLGHLQSQYELENLHEQDYLKAGIWGALLLLLGAILYSYITIRGHERFVREIFNHRKPQDLSGRRRNITR